MKHILPISRKSFLLSGVLSRIPKPQKTASFEAASMGKEIESPRPVKWNYINTPLKNLSSIKWRKAGDSHSIPPLGGTQDLTGLAPSSEVYLPPSPSYHEYQQKTALSGGSLTDLHTGASKSNLSITKLSRNKAFVKSGVDLRGVEPLQSNLTDSTPHRRKPTPSPSYQLLNHETTKPFPGDTETYRNLPVINLNWNHVL